MRVLLCNNRSGLYYEASGKWNATRDEAYDFGHSQVALRFATESGLKGVELVIAYDDPELDVTLPLEKPSRITAIGQPEVPGRVSPQPSADNRAVD